MSIAKHCFTYLTALSQIEDSQRTSAFAQTVTSLAIQKAVFSQFKVLGGRHMTAAALQKMSGMGQ